MKKVIITVVTIVVAAAVIGMVLSNNKKANQEKMDIVNKGSGAAAVRVSLPPNKPWTLILALTAILLPIRT